MSELETLIQKAETQARELSMHLRKRKGPQNRAFKKYAREWLKRCFAQVESAKLALKEKHSETELFKKKLQLLISELNSWPHHAAKDNISKVEVKLEDPLPQKQNSNISDLEENTDLDHDKDEEEWIPYFDWVFLKWHRGLKLKQIFIEPHRMALNPDQAEQSFEVRDQRIQKLFEMLGLNEQIGGELGSIKEGYRRELLPDTDERPLVKYKKKRRKYRH